MGGIPTIESYLAVEGALVRLEERGPGVPTPLAQYLSGVARWLELAGTADPQHPPTMALKGSRPHGGIRFIGVLEKRMIEPLVLTLRALATGSVDLDTPATPVFLGELTRDVHLRLVVGVTCPHCPGAAAVALRLPCVCTRVHVDVIRADVPGAPSVRAVPTLLVNNRTLGSGPVHEMQLVQSILDWAR